MNDKINQEIKSYFDEQQVIDLPLNQKERLINKVKLNKAQTKVNIAKRSIAVAYSFCLLLLTIMSVILLTYKKPDPTIYYGNDEATKVSLELEHTKTYINTNYPQYNFIFEDFDIYSLFGYYTPDENNKLLAIEFVAYQKQTPYTVAEINLIVNNQFIFNDKDSYITDSNYNKTTNYEIYKITYSNAFLEYLKAYVKYENYEIFLYFDIINEDLLTEFL